MNYCHVDSQAYSDIPLPDFVIFYLRKSFSSVIHYPLIFQLLWGISFCPKLQTAVKKFSNQSFKNT